MRYKIDHIPYSAKRNKREGLPMKAEYITWHSTSNLRSTAQNERDWLINPNNDRQASWHIAIDENEAVEAIPLNEVAWHAGDGRNGTGNRKSIAIEMCESGDRNKVIENTIELTVKLLKERGWGVDRIKRHYDWSGKNCPRILSQNNWEQYHKMKAEVAKRLQGNRHSNIAVSKPTQKASTQNKIWRNYINGQIVKDLQTELNRQFNKGLAVDGWFGQNTINALVNVRKGARGNLTRIIQRRLIAKGYKLRHGPDGIFGNGTYNAVVKFQRANKLSADGIVGKNTWKALFRK